MYDDLKTAPSIGNCGTLLHRLSHVAFYELNAVFTSVFTDVS